MSYQTVFLWLRFLDVRCWQVITGGYGGFSVRYSIQDSFAL